MADIDPDLRDKIVETHTDMKHVRRRLDAQDNEIEELKNQHDERLRELEKNQSRLMTYVLLIGSAITIGLNFFWEVYHKIWK